MSAVAKPTPEQMQMAAQELSDANDELEAARVNLSNASSREIAAQNRVNAAAKALRSLTDRLVPPEREGAQLR